MIAKRSVKILLTLGVLAQSCGENVHSTESSIEDAPNSYAKHGENSSAGFNILPSDAKNASAYVDKIGNDALKQYENEHIHLSKIRPFIEGQSTTEIKFRTGKIGSKSVNFFYLTFGFNEIPLEYNNAEFGYKSDPQAATNLTNFQTVFSTGRCFKNSPITKPIYFLKLKTDPAARYLTINSAEAKHLVSIGWLAATSAFAGCLIDNKALVTPPFSSTVFLEVNSITRTYDDANGSNTFTKSAASSDSSNILGKVMNTLGEYDDIAVAHLTKNPLVSPSYNDYIAAGTRITLKGGNNGTQNCDNFCKNNGGIWGPTYARCLSGFVALKDDSNAIIKKIMCSKLEGLLPNIATERVYCRCSN